MDDDEKNPIFDTDSVSYGAAQLQQILLLQEKDMMMRRWLTVLEQQDNSGGKFKSERSYRAAIRVLYEELRPRIKERGEEKKKDGKHSDLYEYDVQEMDRLSQENPEKLMRMLLEYLELDLKLTKVDTKKEYGTLSAWRKQGFT